MLMEKKKLTSASGAPVADNQNVATAGRRGPMLLQDVWFLEKLAHFDREVIPERRMHAKGSGAFGKFWNSMMDNRTVFIPFMKPGFKDVRYAIWQIAVCIKSSKESCRKP